DAAGGKSLAQTGYVRRRTRVLDERPAKGPALGAANAQPRAVDELDVRLGAGGAGALDAADPRERLGGGRGRQAALGDDVQVAHDLEMASHLAGHLGALDVGMAAHHFAERARLGGGVVIQAEAAVLAREDD